MPNLWESTGKVRYGHKETAEAAVASMEKKGRGKMDAYACEDCSGWHIGHPAGLSLWGFLRLGKVTVGLAPFRPKEINDAK